MAIIVQHQTNYKKYVLLGAGLGMYKAVRPSYFGGNLFPHEEEGVESVMAVCGSDGGILFIEKKKLRVIEVDGIKIGDLQSKLGAAKEVWDKDKLGYNICPGCHGEVDPSDVNCPFCGLKIR